MNLMDLYAKITLDDSEFNKGLDGASSNVGKLGEKIKSGLATAAKVGAAALTAAATGIGVLVKQSVDSYGEYEQLVGGVETLFKDSAGKVQEYAANAYKTSGMSANDYMNTVTSFSASLLQSLGGDTEKAAKYADGAITDMSDNANKMGTSMESIQYAYQGFAKQNYTMLDNLKLGYGGTKEEMVRLVNDAHKVNGAIKENDLSFQNVVAAIHVVQTELGITGTTAKEAATTIQGSSASMKAAWQNLLVGFANGNADLSGLIAQFVESVKVYAGNIMPVITQALQGVAMLIQQIAPIIASELPALISSTLPALLSAASTLIGGVASALPALLQTLMVSAAQIVPQIGATIVNSLPQLISVAMDMVLTLAEGLANNADKIVSGALSLLSKIVDTLTSKESLSRLGQAAVDLIVGLGNGIANNIDKIVDIGGDIVDWLIDGVKKVLPKLYDAFTGAIDEIGAKLSEKFPSLSWLFDNLSTVIGAATGAIIAFKAAMAISEIVNAAKTAILGLNAALNANPIMLVVTLIGLLVGAFASLISKNDEAKSKLVSIWNSIKGAAVSVFGFIKDFLTTIWNAIKSVATTVWNAIKTVIVGTVNAVKSVIENVWNGLKSLLSSIWNGLKSLASSVWEGIKNAIITPINAVKTTLTNIWETLKNTITNVWNTLKNTATSVWNSIKNAIMTPINAVKTFLSNTWTNIKNTASNAWESIKNAIINPIKELPGKIKGIGSDIVSGLWNGIKNAAGWLLDKVTGFANGILDKVKGVFGIHSPSKVFAGIGKNMALGLGEGWQDEYRSISNDIEKSLRFNPASIGINGYGVSSIGAGNAGEESESTETVTEYNMQVTINLNGSDYTSQRQIAEEISVQLQNLVNRRSAAWA